MESQLLKNWWYGISLNKRRDILNQHTWWQQSQVNGKKSICRQTSTLQCFPRFGNAGVPINIPGKMNLTKDKNNYLWGLNWVDNNWLFTRIWKRKSGRIDSVLPHFRVGRKSKEMKMITRNRRWNEDPFKVVLYLYIFILVVFWEIRQKSEYSQIVYSNSFTQLSPTTNATIHIYFPFL